MFESATCTEYGSCSLSLLFCMCVSLSLTVFIITGNGASKSAPQKNRYSMSSISCFGVDLTPDNIAISMVYFVQGVLGLARLAVSFYFKDDLHLDPAEVYYILTNVKNFKFILLHLLRKLET